MNVDNQNPPTTTSDLNATAFSPGYCAWLLANDPQSKWWKEINFHTGFLLSRLLHDKKTPQSLELKKIIDETKIPTSHTVADCNVTFIGSQNHFQNKWICLIDTSTNWSEAGLIKNLNDLKCTTIRVFSPLQITPGLKSSFPQLDFVSDSN